MISGIIIDSLDLIDSNTHIEIFIKFVPIHYFDWTSSIPRVIIFSVSTLEGFTVCNATLVYF